MQKIIVPIVLTVTAAIQSILILKKENLYLPILTTVAYYLAKEINFPLKELRM